MRIHSKKGEIAMDIMGIQQTSVAMSQAKLLSTVSTEVLSMGLDLMETTGEGMIDMMQRSMMAGSSSVTPHLGVNMDIMV